MTAAGEEQSVNSKGHFDPDMKGAIICTPVIIYNTLLSAPLRWVSREKGETLGVSCSVQQSGKSPGFVRRSIAVWLRVPILRNLGGRTRVGIKATV